MRRPERVADTLREEIAQIVGYELEDPRLTNGHSDRRARLRQSARRAAFTSRSQATKQEHKQRLQRCDTQRRTCESNLGLSLNLPRTPEIHFVRDRVEEEGERVDQLLQRDRTENGKVIGKDDGVVRG